jgi:hypothetical protein
VYVILKFSYIYDPFTDIDCILDEAKDICCCYLRSVLPSLKERVHTEGVEERYMRFELEPILSFEVGFTVIKDLQLLLDSKRKSGRSG